MNFGASRLGFWFRYPLQPDRKLASNRVLVFYDMYTSVYVNSTGTYDNDYYTTRPEYNPGTAMWPNIRDQEISLGNQPELVVGYNNLPADLTQYAHVWDIGFASPYASNPTLNPTSILTTYLQSGGAMFMLGENYSLNSQAPDRDDTISVFLAAVGGGSVTESNTDFNNTYSLTVESEFLIANQNSSVSLNRPGGFSTVGTGTAMTSALSGTYPAVMWKTGSLSNAPKGAIISVLDINFLDNTYLQSDFLDNLSAALNNL